MCSPRVDRVFPKNPYLIRKPTEIVLCAHSIAIIIILISFVTDRMIIKYTLCMIQDQEIMNLYGKKNQDLDPKIVLTYSPTSKCVSKNGISDYKKARNEEISMRTYC